IYALGVIMYEMVTGEVPYRGTNYLNVLSQVLSEEPVPPSQINKDVGPDLEAVIEKALEKDRDHRYQTMEELAADLDALMSESMASTGARITASRRKRKSQAARTPLRYVLWVAGLSVIVAAVVVTVRMVMGGGGERPAVTPAAGAVAADAGLAGGARADAGPKVPATQLAHIKIESRPPGVEVFEGGRSLGLTPTTWEGVKRDEPFVLYGSKEGYDDNQMKLNPIVQDGKTVTIVLTKAKGGKGKRIKRPPAGSDGKSTLPGGDNTAGGDLIPPTK
ncbi:MAG TPA: hypothetical protein VFU21_07650, partial [Kofleriaceae bacterium]|nr:hypothetical protein [Kofleriaceae bacterium]